MFIIVKFLIIFAVIVLVATENLESNEGKGKIVSPPGVYQMKELERSETKNHSKTKDYNEEPLII